jgi:hypothetical protein
MDLPNIRSVASDPENPGGDRLVLLRMSHAGGSQLLHGTNSGC